TLLLEVDLRKPTVAQNMGIKPTPGVAEQALNRGAILLESLSKVGGEESNLYAIPAGSYAHNPLELLSSETFKHLLDRLKELFPYIVLDGPPMLAVSDAAVIGHLVDSVVVAVKAESTKIEMAREAINRLHKANVTITGTVLCQADAHRMNYYGDHYTHYYDASYYGYREAAKEGA
ncbi:MAG: putative exopolysaccharide biosynthesis protein, partial [Halothiobacillaceae bacterium]